MRCRLQAALSKLTVYVTLGIHFKILHNVFYALQVNSKKVLVILDVSIVVQGSSLLDLVQLDVPIANLIPTRLQAAILKLRVCVMQGTLEKLQMRVNLAMQVHTSRVLAMVFVVRAQEIHTQLILVLTLYASHVVVFLKSTLVLLVNTKVIANVPQGLTANMQHQMSVHTVRQDTHLAGAQ